MPMIDMAMTPDEVKKDLAVEMAPAPKVPRYPWGLELNLGEEELKKLGLLDGDVPPIAAMVTFTAEAKITSVSANESEGPDGTITPCRRMILQIQKMSVNDGAANPAEEQKARAKRWYPGVRDSDGDEDGD